MLAGIETASFVAPVRERRDERRATRGGRSGVGSANAVREIGGVLGIAVLAAVFSERGGYATPSAFVDGFVPALTIGAITVGLGAAAALLIPRTRRGAASLEPTVAAA